ncbi:MAG: hypothetical protein HKN14_13260 [Marinicaulis sp.]|nr:hypothetical protein [Marinicaulis sp.]NNE41874.1 hypothetical protein [Marinicaulis sp.]NNL90562.1 hypothetical protein [Marinicaulis sp.]
MNLVSEYEAISHELMRLDGLANQENEDQKSCLKSLFEIFVKIEKSLDLAEESSSSRELEEISGRLIEAQSHALQIAINIPARNARDLLYKLALWRWDAPEINGEHTDLKRYEAVTYSTFLDLAMIVGDDEVLKKMDRECLESQS